MSNNNWEINGNLDDPQTGLSNYTQFSTVVAIVKDKFDKSFGPEWLNKVNFYVDNATKNSGYTPIATVVLKSIVVIKLGISPQDGADKIIFQFAHELMHIIFFSVFGIDKKRANETEESICTAASLCVIHDLIPQVFQGWCNYVQNLSNKAYATGLDVAKKVNFSLADLLPLVLSNTYQ